MTDTVTIFCKNNKIYKEVPIGTPLSEVFRLVGSPLPYPPMNAQVNNLTESLTCGCWKPQDVEFVDYTQRSGMRTYVRSLCHILSKAVNDLWPNAELHLEHPISKGYYCLVKGEQPLDEAKISQLKEHMQKLIDADLPFVPHLVQTAEAVALFKEKGMDDKVRLIESAGMAYTPYYELDGYANFFYGCLTPSTGSIHLFDLVPYKRGMLLCVPRQSDPSQLEPIVQQDKMYEAYKEHLNLQEAIRLNYVGDLNIAIKQKQAQDIILVSEAMQEKQIAHIAEEIAKGYERGVRIVLISGPSSSGKTTFCKRLQVQLTTNLLRPIGLSLDDYFLDRENTPRDEHGEYDFESLYALDLPYLNQDLERLMAGEEIDLPTFDFASGKRIFRGQKLKMEENSVLVMEGIHGLNPELTSPINAACTYKIYVSALTTISLDSHNWIPTTDNRLLRRIIRDYRYRGYSAEQTILRWPSVRRGENKWIFPYQENADAMFNSAMIYELAAMRPYAEPILAEVQENSPAYAEAQRLLRFLHYFCSIPIEKLPKTSLLREFLGGGSFKY